MSSIRTGLVGAGGISTRHLPAWLALGAEVVVYSDHGAAELTERFGGTAVSTFEELLDRCDIVDVVTPTPVHHTYTDAALRAGKDVICEKPLTRHHDDAVALVRLARQTGRELFPAHVVRYFPEYAAMREAVRDGRIGNPAVARYTRTGSFPTWAPWFADTEQSGGIVLDLMVHDLDIARWVSGEVTEVYATISQGDREGAPVSTAHAVLTHANGAISHVRGVWGPPHIQFSTSFNVAGSGGVLSFDSAVQDSWRLDTGAPRRGTQAAPDTSFVESPYLTELRDFMGAIAGDRRPSVNAADGVVALDLALAAAESIRTEASVRFTTWSEEAR